MFRRTNFSTSAGLRPLKSFPKSCFAYATRALALSAGRRHRAPSIVCFTPSETSVIRIFYDFSASMLSSMRASSFVAPSMMSMTFWSTLRVSGAEDPAGSVPSGMPSAS